MGKIHCEVSPDFTSSLGYLRAYSWYNKETKERIISKKDASSRKIEKHIQGRSVSSIQRDLKKLKEQGVVTERDKLYIIKEPLGSYIELPEDFMKKMLNTFNADTINIYNWLYRKWGYQSKQGKPCLFSYGDLAEKAMGKCNNSSNRKQARHNLAQLVLNGLIAYRVVRVGRTYLRMLEYIKTEFIMVEAFDLYEQELVQDGEDYNGKTEDLVEDINFDQIESIGVLGLPKNTTPEKILPKLYFEEQNLAEYKSIEKLLPNIQDKEQLKQELLWLGKHDSRNKEYVKYELERLKS